MPLAVCATPIGNLDDVTLRVLDELRGADVVLCEDTRVTRVLLDRHGIKPKLLSYHEHNEAKRTAELVPRLDELDRDAPTVVYCAGGYRSSTAASVLRAAGFADVSDLLGGWSGWVRAGLPVA